MITFRLQSAPMLNAPGMVRWAQNGYHFAKDREVLKKVFVEGWKLPAMAADALLSGKVSFTVDADQSVVFQLEGCNDEG